LSKAANGVSSISTAILVFDMCANSSGTKRISVCNLQYPSASSANLHRNLSLHKF
jgi:hypothetical protein